MTRATPKVVRPSLAKAPTGIQGKGFFRGSSVLVSGTAGTKKFNHRGIYDYLDDSFHCSTDRVDWWFHCVSRGRWPDTSAAVIRGDLSDHAFCPGKTDRVIASP